MRNTRLTLFVGFMLISLQAVFAQAVVFTPEKPSPGEAIKVTYDPTGTPLEGMDFEATAYLFENDNPQATELMLEKAGEKYEGTIETHANTQIVYIAFENEKEEKKDNNADKGYKVMLYTADKTKPVSGAYANTTNAYRYLGLKNDPKENLASMQKEFANYPSQNQYWTQMAIAATDTKNEEALTKVKERITAVVNNKKATEDDLMGAATMARILKNQEQAEMLTARTAKKFPKGAQALSNFQRKFYETKELAEKEKMFNSFEKKKFQGDRVNAIKEYMASQLASAYARENNWDKFDQYAAMVENKLSKANLYNSLAWGMSGQSIEGEGKNVEKGLEISKKSLDLVKSEMENPGNAKPGYYTEKRWKTSLGYSYAMFADTYALLAYKNGNTKDALKYQEIACTSRGAAFSDVEMNERYAVYLEAEKGPEKTEAFLEKRISKGVASAAMKEQYKKVFLANNSKEDAFNKYMASLEKEATAQQRKELEKKMIDKEAPMFTLNSLDGNTYALANLKGKVIVVDFWATWCGPCKASFPGMQLAVNNHSDQDDVVFLFINSWESAKDKEKSAGDFITKNEYTFNVLMDKEDEVVKSFGVSGIPTKFVIDKNGRIRFKSVGFDGNTEGLADELKLMIEMAKTASDEDYATSMR